MILITTSTFLNVFVVNLSFYGSRAPVPKILKKVSIDFVNCFLYFIRYTLVKIGSVILI